MESASRGWVDDPGTAEEAQDWSSARLHGSGEAKMSGRPREDTPASRLRDAYVLRYGFTWQRPSRKFTTRFMEQLDNCKDDAARRLLLGVSKKTSPSPAVHSDTATQDSR